jgi:uncharacterized protein YndB with AHSA1/START domain
VKEPIVTDLSIYEQVRIQAPASRVWRALTTPTELSEWYAPGCRWEIESLTPGAIARFYNTATDIQTATVETAVAPQRLALRWHADPTQQGAAILNTFTLTPDGDTTVVTIAQSGYEALQDAVRDGWLEQDRGALAAIAASLKAHVER